MGGRNYSCINSWLDGKSWGEINNDDKKCFNEYLLPLKPHKAPGSSLTDLLSKESKNENIFHKINYFFRNDKYF